MDKKTRFNAAYDYLLSIGRAHKQKDIAVAMSSTEANISQALKGHPKVLTDNFLLRFLTAYPDIFSMSWMFTGKGSMLLNEPQPSPPVRTYTLPEQSPDIAAEAAPLSDRDLLAATYTALIRLSDSFRAYQSRTESKLRELESLLAHLAPSSPLSSPNVSPHFTDDNQNNNVTN